MVSGTLESSIVTWISQYRPDGRQYVWCCVGEWFPDVNVVNRVAHGGCGVLVWTAVLYVVDNKHCMLLMPFLKTP